MGQYYNIINVDKKQQLYPFDYNNGLKLMEWSYNPNPLVLALTNLLSGEWKGDRVYIVEDYADTEDPSEVWCATLEKLQKEFGIDDIYGWASETYARILPEQDLRPDWMDDTNEPEPAPFRASTEDQGYRYLYNHGTKQFVDLSKCPVEWLYQRSDKKVPVSISPLSLLLAMGNGRGGGDYDNPENEHLLGSWCATSASIEVAKERLENTGDYEELVPNFIEKK